MEDNKDTDSRQGTDNGLNNGEREYAGYVSGSEGRKSDDNVVISRRTLTWLDIATLIGIFFISNVVGTLLGSLIRTTTGADPEFASFVTYLITFALTIAFAVWQRARQGALKPILRFSMKSTNVGMVLWGVVLVIVTSIVLEPLLQLFPAEGIEILYDSIGIGGWALITSVIMAPILEEILFRGIIQQSLTEQFGGWKSVLAASAVFAIVHLIPQQIINAFFVGIILGYIYIKTKSLIPVILIHALNNALAFIQMKIFGTETMVTVRELIGNDVAYWIVYGIFAAIFITALLNLWHQLSALPDTGMSRKQKSNMEKGY